MDGASKGHAFNDASLNLVTAYGLALQGLGQNAVGGNLMPTTVLRKSMWKDKTRYFGMAAGIAAAAAGVMFVGPVRNYFAVKGTTKPAVIQQAVQRFNQLKSEATEAGVLSAAAATFRGERARAPGRPWRQYNMLVADVQKMFRERRRGEDVVAVAHPGRRGRSPRKCPTAPR